MNVVLVNHSDTLGGASVVTFRLMEALRLHGIDAHMLVRDNQTDCPWVGCAASRWRAHIPFYKEHARIFLGNGFSRADLFKVSIATDGLSLSNHPMIKQADVVVLNWVNQGYLSLKEVRRIAAIKPVAWVMHDMWNLTGICHHAGECDRYTDACHHCPLLHTGASARDLSATTFRRKQRLYERTDIRFVAVSNWLAEKARNSALLRNQRVNVIHNPFDIDGLRPTNPLSRGALGLPENVPLVVLCAARLDDPIKCFDKAIEALNGITDTKAVAVLIGELRDHSLLSHIRLPFRHLGPIYDNRRLRSVFSHASAVLSTSSFESFGATLLEGQAVGATPVAPVHDGRGDIITDGESGYAFGPERSAAEALRMAINEPIAAETLREAASRYSYRSVASAYAKLFTEMVDNFQL